MSDETKISTGIDSNRGIEELASSLCTLICESPNSIVDLLSNEQFEAKMDEKLDEKSHRRLMIMVDRTMYSDLLFLKGRLKTEISH